jgi:hypothetical protein
LIRVEFPSSTLRRPSLIGTLKLLILFGIVPAVGAVMKEWAFLIPLVCALELTSFSKGITS